MYIGIDVGGMSIKAGIVNDEGKLLLKRSVPTPLETNEAFCEAMYSAVKNVIDEYGEEFKIDAVGIGAPGVVDRKNGLLVHSSNIPYKNAPVAEYLKQKLGDIPVFVENDANCAAVGEYYAANGAENVVFVTLGTGVGGGIIINGKLFTGSNGAGGEIGHIVTHAGGRKCNCGRYGCWEAYASTSGLIRLTEENRGRIEAVKNGEKISGRTAFDEARKGDAAAIEVRDQWIEEIAIGITDIINIFQPDEVVIGGAIIKEGDVIMEPVRKYVYDNEYTTSSERIRHSAIIPSRLGEDAGIIGAALLYKNQMD